MTVDHRSMSRRTQILTYIVSSSKYLFFRQMKSVKDVPVNYSFPFRSCSFHASGPEWPQKTQHTRLQEVLVFLLMIPLLFFFSHTLSLRTFPPSALLSARKLSLLVSLTQNANLISKLWTIEKLLFLCPQRLTKKKKLDFSPLLSVPVFFFPSLIRHVDETDAKIHPKFAGFVPQLFFVSTGRKRLQS